MFINGKSQNQGCDDVILAYVARETKPFVLDVQKYLYNTR